MSDVRGHIRPYCHPWSVRKPFYCVTRSKKPCPGVEERTWQNIYSFRIKMIERQVDVKRKKWKQVDPNKCNISSWICIWTAAVCYENIDFSGSSQSHWIFQITVKRWKIKVSLEHGKQRQQQTCKRNERIIQVLTMLLMRCSWSKYSWFFFMNFPFKELLRYTGAFHFKKNWRQ